MHRNCFRQIARDDDIGRHIFGDYAAGTNDDAITNVTPGQMTALPPIQTSLPIVSGLTELLCPA